MKTRTKPTKSFTVKRILVPIDFSGVARGALRCALTLAEQFDAKIFLMHVVEPPVYPTEMGVVVYNQESTVETAFKELETISKKSIPSDLRGRIIVNTGVAYDQITQVAERMKMDMIVLTTHGYTGLKHVLLGSTAERVVRHAPCPVLTVRIT